MPVEIPLTRGFVALVDPADAERVLAYPWTALTPRRNLSAYAIYKKGVITQSGRHELLHRFLMDAPPSLEVDHIDRNGLNCQRNNMRLATSGQNKVNRASANNVTGFRGVRRHKGGTFSASIRLHLQETSLGHFATAVEAAVAYNVAARELHGDFAVLNVVPDEIDPVQIPPKSHRARAGRYKGVSPRGDRFRSTFYHANQLFYIGTFATAEMAARAYDQVAIEHHGPTAIVNFPNPRTAA